MIGRPAPLVALVHGTGEAASSGEWSSIAARGAFALAAWCKKHNIEDPRKRSFDLLAVDRDDEEADEKAEPPEPEEERSALAVLDLRCTISASLARRLVWDELPAPARKLLLWALSHLMFAEQPDVVGLSKRFLPTDIGVTPEEASLAYRTLIERDRSSASIFRHRAAIGSPFASWRRESTQASSRCRTSPSRTGFPALAWGGRSPSVTSFASSCPRLTRRS